MKKMVEPRGHTERFLTKKTRKLVQVTFCKAQDSIRVFLRSVRSPSGEMMPLPLQKLATADHADGTWLCLDIPRVILTEAAALAEARLWAQQHCDA